ncbi:MAG TPA: hypothetical protein VJQ52_07330 [Steroidobacteraceae bacterium]|nr:hypothetical protein [Steroidobacteraceae bacterium]
MNDWKRWTGAARVLLAATCACAGTAAYAEAPGATGELPTVCLDTGTNITLGTAVTRDDRGNTYVTGGKRSNDSASGKRVSVMATVKYDATGREVWSRSYQGTFGCFDHGRAIATDKAGNVYVTGLEWISGNDPAHPHVDASRKAYATVKYDADGNRKWVSRYFERSHRKNEPRAVVVDDSGDVYVTGLSDGTSHGEIATIKYDGRDGRQLWALRYPSEYGVLGVTGMVSDSKRHMYVAATVCTQRTQLGNCSDFEYRVLKYDRSGRLAWTAQYDNGAGFAGAATSLTAARDDVYVTGWSCSTPYIVFEYDGNVFARCDEADYATVKVKGDGTRAWVARYHGSAPGNYAPGAIAVDDEGSAYVTGSGTYGDFGVHTVKYDKTGKQSWATVTDGKDWASPAAIAVNSRGQAYVAGAMLHDYRSHFGVVAYDTHGNELWKQKVQGADQGRGWAAAAVALDKKGRVSVTGGTLDQLPWGPMDSWYLTNSYSAEGQVLWTREF